MECKLHKSRDPNHQVLAWSWVPQVALRHLFSRQMMDWRVMP